MYVCVHGVCIFVYNKYITYAYRCIQFSLSAGNWFLNIPMGTQRLTEAQIPYLQGLSICVTYTSSPLSTKSSSPRVANRIEIQYAVVLPYCWGSDDKKNICICSVQGQFLMVFEYFLIHGWLNSQMQNPQTCRADWIWYVKILHNMTCF